VGRMTDIETVLLDLDGTLYVGSQVVPGAPEAVRWLRDQGLTVRFTTNTDSIPPAALADRLARLGFQATEDELVTPVAVAARLFASAPEARVLAVAADGVRQLLAGCLAGPGEPVTHVLVADPSYGATYADLDAAFRALRAGAELVATQVNRIARRDDGEHLDTGGWVRLLEYATGQTARVLGKPSPEFFTAPLDALGRGAGTALVVGDDLTADVGGGRAVGAGTVLVRSGKGDRPQPGAEAEPDAVVDSIADLPDLLQR
jgi:HAD superfamily hydrolase (TIGR01458 family)